METELVSDAQFLGPIDDDTQQIVVDGGVEIHLSRFPLPSAPELELPTSDEDSNPDIQNVPLTIK